ncbi:MAG TPA: glycine cleavage system aminomethyltransferase GcvT [Rhodoglobus sp.]|nr:glycine cleavage system aminomethyltransferase GcvT [Rhodoglobus sp.]
MTDPSQPDLRRSPLHAVHEAAGASFTDFAGWLMPVRYSSDLAEHHAVRTAAGIFDISHMGQIEVSGPQAGDALDLALAGRLSSIAVGQAKYSLLLERDGGIIDDLIVYRLAGERFLVVANASNRAVVAAALADRAARFEATVTDVSDGIALIAVQGPAAQTIVEQATGVDLADLRYYRVATAALGGAELLIARTGYTGENGYELYLPTGSAVELWDALTAAGAEAGLAPAGLAARDTLRLEAGMPLYGHELSLQVKPAQAGLGRVPVMDKEFVGREALLQADPDARVLVGLAAEGRRAARAGYRVLQGDAVVGEVTSGALSPTLGYPIAMAYVDAAASAPGTALDLDVRGSRIPASVVALPFYTRKKD